MYILFDGQDAQIRPYNFSKKEAKRLENEMSGIINPPFNGLIKIHIICVDMSTFHFSPW